MENTDEKESASSWLVPLILLAILVAFGAWFCAKPPAEKKAETPPATTGNTNTAANANR